MCEAPGMFPGTWEVLLSGRCFSCGGGLLVVCPGTGLWGEKLA